MRYGSGTSWGCRFDPALPEADDAGRKGGVRPVFVFLAFGLAAMYIVMASNAVEFENKTLERTELVERVVSKPTFHMDRLTAYVRDRWEALKGLSAGGSAKGVKP
jgi:hypothetical protein